MYLTVKDIDKLLKKILDLRIKSMIVLNPNEVGYFEGLRHLIDMEIYEGRENQMFFDCMFEKLKEFEKMVETIEQPED